MCLLALLLMLGIAIDASAQFPVVRLRNLEKAPDAGYILRSGTGGAAEWQTDSLGALNVRTTPIAYVPSASGNSSNLNEAVVDPNGDRWVIDSEGDALRMSNTADGSETKVQAGSNVVVTGTGTLASPYIISASGGGGSGAPFQRDSLAVGSLWVTLLRSGGSTTTITNPSSGRYRLAMSAGSSFVSCTVFGNNTTLNGSNEIEIELDNSANGYRQRLTVQVYDANNGALINQFLTGTNHVQTVTGNITKVTLPGMNGFGGTGYFIEIR
jgi:hypothetical protein